MMTGGFKTGYADSGDICCRCSSSPIHFLRPLATILYERIGIRRLLVRCDVQNPDAFHRRGWWFRLRHHLVLQVAETVIGN